MFGKKETNSVVIVETKEHLKAAINRKESQIEVKGKLAKNMSWMGKLSAFKISALIAVLGGVAVSAGVSSLAISAVPIAAVAKITGTEIAGIIVACGLSISLILAILRDYTIIVKSDGSILMNRKV